MFKMPIGTNWHLIAKSQRTDLLKNYWYEFTIFDYNFLILNKVFDDMNF